MNFLTPEQIIRIQSKVETKQNHMVNESSLYAITAKFFQGYFDQEEPIDVAMTYFEDVVNKHIFGNGNKRTAIIAAIVFLEMNGLRVNLKTDPAYAAIMDYFQNKDTNALKGYVNSQLTTRTYENPSVDSFNYHLDHSIEKHIELMQQLSLT